MIYFLFFVKTIRSKTVGKDLMSVDELAVMDGNKCILQLRGVRPFMSDNEETIGLRD